MKEYKLIFQGYWRDVNKDNIPTKSGIYMVYRCDYDKSSDTVGLKEIVYIGKAENLNERLANHKLLDNYKGRLTKGEELCYAIAFLNNDDLLDAERALIYAQKPPLNTNGVDEYSGPDIAMKVDGQCLKLKYTDYTITTEHK